MWRILPRVYLLVLAAVLLLAPLLALPDPMRTDTTVLQSPGGAHLLGTDLLGRDTLSRLIYGGRFTVGVALAATGITMSIGTIWALLVATIGGWADHAAVSLLDSLLALPSLIVALVFLTALGQGAGPMVLAISVSQIAPVTLVLRGAARSALAAPYIEGARAIGAAWPGIILRHLLVTIRPTIVAYAGVTFSYSVLTGVTLGFLGLGVALGEPEWGAMLAQGRLHFAQAPHVVLIVGLCIVLTVLSVNTLLDALAEMS